MHSIGKIVNIRRRKDLQDQTLGFIWNRADQYGNASPMVGLHKDESWKWLKVTGHFDPITFEEFYASCSEKETFWPGADDPTMHKEKPLHRLFYLLYDMRAYAAEEPCTCYAL